LLNWLEECCQDLINADIEETTPKNDQTTNENFINQCNKQTIDNGLQSKTNSNQEIRPWESEQQYLPEKNLNSNVNYSVSYLPNNCTNQFSQIISQTDKAKEQEINSIKDLLIFNNDHQYTKNTNNTNLPPLSIEEILNDNIIDIQDPIQINSNQTSFYDNSIESSDNFLLNDEYLNYSFEQPFSTASFDF